MSQLLMHQQRIKNASKKLFVLTANWRSFSSLVFIIFSTPYGNVVRKSDLGLYKTTTKFCGQYIALFLNNKQNLLIQIHHYNFINKTPFKNNFYSSLISGAKIWGKHSADDFPEHEILLKIPTETAYESELVLEYYYSGHKLQSLTFTFSPGNIFNLPDHNTVIIGGSQSYNAPAFRRAASLDNNEINPPLSLVIALKAICKTLHIQEIIGVKAHKTITTYPSPQTALYSYDNLWKISYGQDYGDYYKIPIHVTRNPDAEVLGKHKSRAKRKRIIRMQMKADILNNLRQLLH